MGISAGVNPHSPKGPLHEGAGGHREDMCVLELHLSSCPGPRNLRGRPGVGRSQGAPRGALLMGSGSEMGALCCHPLEEPLLSVHSRRATQAP